MQGLVLLYALGVTSLAWFLFRMLYPSDTFSPKVPIKCYGEDRRKITYVAPCEIPGHIIQKEKYFRNSRDMMLHTSSWRPKLLGKQPRALIVQVCGFTDSNTFLPMMRSIRLAQEGFAVVGMDPEGVGRSDGLHGYIPSFTALVNDYWQWFVQDIRSIPNYATMPTFLLGESMGGNVVVQLLLRDNVEKTHFFKGAIMLAPMLQISHNMKPPDFAIPLLQRLVSLFPTLPVASSKDVSSQAYRRKEILAKVQNAPYGYGLKIRLRTGEQLLQAAELVARRASEVRHPYIILQGGSDVVTCPHIAKEFHAKTKNREGEFKLYEGMWHSLLGGELKENVETVYGDIFEWLERQLKKRTERETGMKKKEIFLKKGKASNEDQTHRLGARRTVKKNEKVDRVWTKAQNDCKPGR